MKLNELEARAINAALAKFDGSNIEVSTNLGTCFRDIKVKMFGKKFFGDWRFTGFEQKIEQLKEFCEKNNFTHNISVSVGKTYTTYESGFATFTYVIPNADEFLKKYQADVVSKGLAYKEKLVDNTLVKEIADIIWKQELLPCIEKYSQNYKKTSYGYSLEICSQGIKEFSYDHVNFLCRFDDNGYKDLTSQEMRYGMFLAILENLQTYISSCDKIDSFIWCTNPHEENVYEMRFRINVKDKSNELKSWF